MKIDIFIIVHTAIILNAIIIPLKLNRMSEPATGFVVEGDKVVRLEGAKNASVSRNLTFDASPLFTVTIAAF